MLKSAEKNDVDISPLFGWGSKFVVRDSNDKVLITCYMRIVGDADINKARTKALRASAELRRKLKEEDSDERLAFIPSTESIDKENLVEVIITLEMPELGRAARNKVNLNYPKEPSSDAGLEEFEEFQLEVDEWGNVLTSEIRKVLEKDVGTERKRLNKMSKSDLLNLYEKHMIGNICESEMYKIFTEYCVYFGTFRTEECKERFFESYEQFSNLPTVVKRQFIDFYDTLDIDLSDLKK